MKYKYIYTYEDGEKVSYFRLKVGKNKTVHYLLNKDNQPMINFFVYYDGTSYYQIDIIEIYFYCNSRPINIKNYQSLNNKHRLYFFKDLVQKLGGDIDEFLQVPF